MPDAIHRDQQDAEPLPAARPRRRSPQAVPRHRTIRFALTDAEHAEVSAAASRAGLAHGTYAAEATLAAARGVVLTPDALLHDVLDRFDRAVRQVRRIGVNLNQAVAALNATGQRTGDLVPYAAHSARGAARLETIGEELRKLIVCAIRAHGSDPRRRGSDPGWRGSDPGRPAR